MKTFLVRQYDGDGKYVMGYFIPIQTELYEKDPTGKGLVFEQMSNIIEIAKEVPGETFTFEEFDPDNEDHMIPPPLRK